MDRRNYDLKTLSVFDTVGSFFVETFYIRHYKVAQIIQKEGRARSITEAYQRTVLDYMNGITTRHDLYTMVVKKLHEFYRQHSGFNGIIFSDFEDKFLSKFIPPEYYSALDERQKDFSLHEIILRTVNEFGAIVLKNDMLARIIDDHNNASNIPLLQDQIVDLFIVQRGDYYVRFAKKLSRNNKEDFISRPLFEKLKDEYVKEKKIRHEIENDKNRAINIISQIMNKLKSVETDSEKKIKMLEDKILLLENEKKDKIMMREYERDVRFDMRDNNLSSHDNVMNVQSNNLNLRNNNLSSHDNVMNVQSNNLNLRNNNFSARDYEISSRNNDDIYNVNHETINKSQDNNDIYNVKREKINKSRDNNAGKKSQNRTKRCKKFRSGTKKNYDFKNENENNSEDQFEDVDNNLNLQRPDLDQYERREQSEQIDIRSENEDENMEQNKDSNIEEIDPWDPDYQGN